MSLVCALWGFSFVVSKYAMQQGFTEMTLACVRYAFVCLVMLPALSLQEGLHFPAREDFLPLLLSGLTGVTFYFMFEYMGVMRTTVVNASLVLAAVPVFSILFGALRGKKYTPACWLGVCISMLGVFFVVYFGTNDAQGQTQGQVLLGNLFLLGAALCWVSYIEISKKQLMKHSSLYVTTWQGVFGFIALIPAALSELSHWQPVPFSGFLCALFLAVICSALCFFWYGQSLPALSSIQAAIFINVSPIVSVIAGVLLLGEPLHIAQAVGGVLILGSIFLVNIGARRSERG